MVVFTLPLPIGIGLRIFTGKSCVLLNSVQEFLKEAWLHLIFSVFLHNQFSSIHLIVTYYRVQMFEQGDSQMLNQIDRKLMIAPSSKLYDKSKFYGKI